MFQEMLAMSNNGEGSDERELTLTPAISSLTWEKTVSRVKDGYVEIYGKLTAAGSAGLATTQKIFNEALPIPVYTGRQGVMTWENGTTKKTLQVDQSGNVYSPDSGSNAFTNNEVYICYTIAE